MSISPFKIVEVINEKKDIPFDMKDYSPWVINRALSFNIETLHSANEMNRLYQLSKEEQFDFYYNFLPKKRRYGKWIKAEKLETIQLLSKYFCINKNVAAQYLQLLSEDDINKIQEKMSRGGK